MRDDDSEEMDEFDSMESVEEVDAPDAPEEPKDDDADSTIIQVAPEEEKKAKRESGKLEYTPEFEQLLKENGDHAQVYSILHQMAHLKYKRLFDRVNIPLIIITATIGFATGIGMDYPHIGVILGAGSMMVSVTKSIMAYMQWSEQSENHRICSLQFGQIATEIKTELSLRKEQRQPPKIMLDVIKVKLKNLMEVAHILDPDVMRGFQQKYMDSEEKRTEYKESGVTFPPIFSNLPGIKILGANTEADRIKQVQKSINDRKDQLDADLARIKIEHKHELEEMTEEITHSNAIRKIQGGAVPRLPPPTELVLRQVQPSRASASYMKKAPISSLLTTMQKNPLHRSASLDPVPS